jgi:hypothetical protein
MSPPLHLWSCLRLLVLGVAAALAYWNFVPILTRRRLTTMRFPRRSRSLSAKRLGKCRWGISVAVALFISVSVTPALPVLGQSCSDVQAVSGVMGYQWRSNSERCEGLYESPVAGTLEFLSLITGAISYDPSTDKVLAVFVPDVGSLQATAVNVRASALELGTYYRMDAKVDSAKSMDWPLSAVITPADLHSDDIGVLGWIERGDAKIYVPVLVFNKTKPHGWDAATVAILRSSDDVEDVRWRLWSTIERGRTPEWRTLRPGLGGTIRAGEPIRLSIAKSPRIQNLEIAARISNSDEWLTALLRVFVP